MFSEATLCVAQDVVGLQLQVVHYLADNDVLHDLSWNTGQGDRTVVGRIVVVTLLLNLFEPKSTKRLTNVITGDETWIYCYGIDSKRQNAA